MKAFLKILIFALIGAVIGFASAASISKVDVFKFFSDHITTISYFLLGLFIILILYSFVLVFQFKSIESKNAQGEEEDEKDALLNKKYCDLSLTYSASLIISIINLSIVLIKVENLVLLIANFICFISAIIFQKFSHSLFIKLNPKRNIPKISDKNYEKKLLDIMDDGEEQVMLGGLYKAFNFLNTGIFLAICLAVAYSLIAKESQMFSILLLCSLLLLSNVIYMVTIRQKA
ncbi:DUF3169 family protein [Bacillus sp. AGMB 02131]|uniref:DUF3169 family protein n=1 Tax=Peribacillus faecalis TaxID=2772559 RepID=A0A927CY99_9BACI|nr:DUF3169 family protein [Peribacillus faecalis]MBD3109861.1 DUF3169 family protein [Peribacillus faecalis]